jgi:hypothetical protein
LGKRRRAPKGAPRRKPRRPDAGSAPAADNGGSIQYGAFSLHDLFQEQVRTMLERTDLDDEQKQSVLIAASCPCCGAGGFSLTAKLKPRR